MRVMTIHMMRIWRLCQKPLQSPLILYLKVLTLSSNILMFLLKYLGEMEEVRGRTIFDEDEIVELPVLVQEGLVCVPGQTLPLNISHPHIMAMMRNIIDSHRTFGILSFRPLDPYMKTVKFKIGSTAEVFEYSQPDEETPFGVCLRTKATVRQRFKVLSARKQIDGYINSIKK